MLGLWRRLEDVLLVYQRPYDPDRSVVCMNEMSRQLLEHLREPTKAKPGTVAMITTTSGTAQ